ncbi:hypothetical protein EDB84DRAFT_1445258 [Lactarius hengduanensis]|nr:hypothetical protein EDB84DRAFT_1445258 [Lactarius hengduanensis]
MLGWLQVLCHSSCVGAGRLWQNGQVESVWRGGKKRGMRRVWLGFSNPHGYGPRVWVGTGKQFVTRAKPVPCHGFAGFRGLSTPLAQGTLKKLILKQLDTLTPPPPCAFKPPSCWESCDIAPTWRATRRHDTDTILRHQDGMRAPPRRYDADTAARKLHWMQRQRHASSTGCSDSGTQAPLDAATAARKPRWTQRQRHASPAGRSDSGTTCKPRRVATTPTAVSPTPY